MDGVVSRGRDGGEGGVFSTTSLSVTRIWEDGIC